MRIKTSKSVLEKLVDLKRFLEFDNNAQVLKLAINFTLSQENIELCECDEDGFEIDINILFGEQKDYYFILIKEKFNINEITKSILTKIIEFGFNKMEYYMKLSKKSLRKFTEMILEDVCI